MDVTLTDPVSQIPDSDQPQPRKPSLFWRATSWLWPTNRDSRLWLCCAMVMLGLVDPVLEQQTVLDARVSSYGLFWISFGLVSGTILGVVVTAAWGRVDWKSSRLVLWGAAAGLVAVCYSTFLTWGTTKIETTQMLGSPTGIAPVIVGERAFLFWFAYLGGLILAGVFLWLSIRGSRMLLNGIKSRWTKVTWKWTRTNTLIGIAVLMFVIGTIQNVFFPRGLLAGINVSFSEGSGTNQFLRGASLVMGCLLFLLISRLFASGGASFWKHLLLLGLFGVGVFGVFSSTVSNYSVGGLEVRLPFAVLFGVTGLLWSSIVVSSDRKPGSELRSIENSTVFKKWPCLWSSLAMMMTLGVSIMMFFFDPAVLVGSRSWETAAYCRNIQRSSGNQIQMESYMFGWARAFYAFRCDFREDVSPDVFGGHEVPGLAVANIRGMTPKIETGTLTTLQSLEISDSMTNTKQLQDLLSIPPSVVLANVEVVDPNESVALDGAYLSISVDDDHRLASLLRSIKSADNALVTISATGKALHPSDLNELVRFSQRVPVQINDSILRQMAESDFKSDLSLRNLIVGSAPSMSEVRFDDPLLYRFLISNDISLKVWGYGNGGSQRFWDIAFAKGKSGMSSDYAVQILEGFDDGDWRKNCQSFGWEFGANDKGEVTHLFLPQGDEIFDQIDLPDDLIGSIETLCLDQYWLCGVSQLAGRGWGTPVPSQSNLNGLDAFTNLKRLVLSQDCEVVNSNILNTIPKIEHLQIRLSDSINSSVDFSVCTQLKSLVYFGTPSKRAMKELASLKNLKRLVVVDLDDGTIQSQQARENIEAFIPGVEIKVVPVEGFRSEPSEKFRKHAIEQAKEARERLEG